MSNPFYDNEFEDFLKKQADQMRMYPGDHVWRNIHHEVHGQTRWPALTFFSILIVASLVTGTILLKPHNAVLSENTNTAAAKSQNTKDAVANSKNKPQYKNNVAVIVPLKQQPAANTDLLAEIREQKIIPDELNPAQIISYADEQVIENSMPNNANSFSAPVPQVNELKNNAVAEAKVAMPHTADENAVAVSEEHAVKISESLPAVYAFNNLASPFFNTSSEDITEINFYSGSYQKQNNDYSSFHLNGLPPAESSSLINNQYNEKISVSPSRIKLGKGFKSHLDFQFYVTPSFSYRKLVDNEHGLLSKSYISALPLTSNYVIDIAQLIQHTPALGYEVGTSVGYNFDSKFAIRAGVQFNMQQYNINAYTQPVQPASISLLTSNNSIAALAVVSGFRSTPAGTEQLSLKNRYYEISVPVGVDWRPVTSGKLSIGFAGAIQPTYKFDKEPFIISSNYKYYADGSALMRNWTLNANFETYLAYQAGEYRIQLGPQIRYQLMPTMSPNYPIKEYLFDYGVKIGLIKSFK